MNTLLLMSCCECRAEIGVPLERLGHKLPQFLNASKWLMSVVTPPGEEPIKMVLLCPECAKHVHEPAVVDYARRVMDKRSS